VFNVIVCVVEQCLCHHTYTLNVLVDCRMSRRRL